MAAGALSAEPNGSRFFIMAADDTAIDSAATVAVLGTYFEPAGGLLATEYVGAATTLSFFIVRGKMLVRMRLNA
jgi:hypothetical protein